MSSDQNARLQVGRRPSYRPCLKSISYELYRVYKNQIIEHEKVIYGTTDSWPYMNRD